MVPLASQMLPPWLQDADWRKRHAALICLAQIAEGCTKVMMRQLEGLVGMCMAGLQDPHAKVGSSREVAQGGGWVVGSFGVLAGLKEEVVAM